MKRTISFLFLIVISFGVIAQSKAPKKQSAPPQKAKSSLASQEADDLRLGYNIGKDALTQASKGQGDANNDKKLTVRELSTFVENLVPDLTEKLNGTPQFPSAYSFGNDFILMIYR